MKNHHLISFCCIFNAVLCTSFLSANGSSVEDYDGWVQLHRNKEKQFASTIYNKKNEPMKFFNGFSIGASAGVGFIHGDLVDYKMFAPLKDFSTHYRFGWRAYAQRELKFGLGAKIHFEAGTLGGGRITGKQSPKITFESQYRTVALQATFDLLGPLFRKDKDKEARMYLQAEAGVGVTFFRAATFWTGEDERVRDFVGYTVTDLNPPTQRYTLDGKASLASALVIPVGFTYGYRINYKTDATFSYTFNSLMTDELDAWSRDWTANDKYSYFGVGLRYNFNREPENFPKKKPKKKKELSSATADDKNAKWRLFGSPKEDVAPREVKIDGPIESRMGNKVDPATQNEELEAVRMKMFELQLKLFEMQYLLGGGKKVE